MALFVAFLTILLISSTIAANVGFFCSTGSYSHDLYTNYLADSFASHFDHHNVTIIQIKVFKFSTQVEFSRPYISYDFTNDTEVIRAQKRALELIWEMIIPFDIHNISGSISGIGALIDIEKSAMKACGSALRDNEFISKLKSLNLDILLVDYAVNECAVGIAHLWDIPVVYASSLPFTTHYIDYLGVSSNPSYVPVYICNYEPYVALLDRALNVYGYVNLAIFRQYFHSLIRKTFRDSFNATLPGLDEYERRTLMFATPWEMFLDMPRPIARNMRYFGCSNCPLPSEEQKITKFPQKSVGVVLVSFGTLLDARDIPLEKLQSFVMAFKQLPELLFVWQLDVSTEFMQKKILDPLNMTMPQNVQHRRWIPIREILRDPKVILIVTHGGATTCMEAVYSGVPFMGISLHSDQYSNVQRLEHRGLGEAIIVTEVDAETVAWYVYRIVKDIDRYKKRILKFRKMLMDLRKFENTPSVFWTDFLTRHFGGSAMEKRQKVEKYWTLRHSGNWIIQANGDIFMLALILCSFMSYALS